MGFLDLFGSPKKLSPDGAVLTQLQKSGSNLSKPHNIEFSLYFPTQETADKAAAIINKRGFEVQIVKNEKQNNLLCFATKTLVPELSALEKIRHDFENLATSLQGEYDGWGTGVEM